MWMLLGKIALADPEDEETRCDLLDPAEIAADARWVPASDGVLELVADAPVGMTWESTVTASLAQLTTKWTQTVAPEESGRIVLRISPPSSAFLDPAAADYLTGLRVHLVGHGERGSLRISSPPAYLAWLNGSAQPPVVWDRATAAIEAPNGIVSAAVRATLQGLEPGVMVEPALPVPSRRTEVE